MGEYDRTMKSLEIEKNPPRGDSRYRRERKEMYQVRWVPGINDNRPELPAPFTRSSHVSMDMR